MTHNGYVAQTVIDTKAFLRLLKEGDKVGVVAFGENAYDVYSDRGKLATVDSSLTVTANAAAAVDRLTFNGDWTAIGRGLAWARTFLDSAALPKACVLLTDGYQNNGPSPLDGLPNYPVMACAMGPESDKALLSEIARRTGGEFFYVPRAADMMKVYNTIRAKSATAALLANQLNDIPSNDYQLIPATVSHTPGGAQISAVWSDGGIAYTRGSPSGNQLSVTLVDPSGSTSPLNPTVVGNGFVIYNVDNPAPGLWQIQLEFAGRGQTINCTGGALQYPSSTRNALPGPKLHVQVPRTIAAGQRLPIDVRLTEDGGVLTNVRAHAAVIAPIISLQDALAKYDDRLGSVELSVSDLAHGMPEPLARLAVLRAKLLPDEDILGHRRFVVHLHDGHERLAAEFDAKVAGAYTIQVEVSGDSSVSGPFQRVDLVSIIAS
ncbi:hypothetical protein WS69_10825 [Burkholderia sp. BDU5]|nr:hypothetical protein WS69_10825 [Burkholderia sp. BDU5]